MKNETKEKNMFLSDQALGAVMMALQRSLMDQSDIVPILKGMKFRVSDTGLVVLNPPIVKATGPSITTSETDTSFVAE